jgi:hypothetical protein
MTALFVSAMAAFHPAMGADVFLVRKVPNDRGSMFILPALLARSECMTFAHIVREYPAHVSQNNNAETGFDVAKCYVYLPDEGFHSSPMWDMWMSRRTEADVHPKAPLVEEDWEAEQLC